MANFSMKINEKIVFSVWLKKEGVRMMPLTMINTGEEAVIQRVKGNEETKRFLENLGFVSGTKVNIVSSIGRCV